MNSEQDACRKEADDILECLTPPSWIGAESIKTLLESGNRTRQKSKQTDDQDNQWKLAEERLLRAVEQAEALDPGHWARDSILGLADMYLGVLYHTQGKLGLAIHFYEQARDAFRYDRSNYGCAFFALAVAYQRRGEQAKADGLIAEALAILNQLGKGKKATARWEKTQKATNEHPQKPGADEGGGTGGGRVFADRKSLPPPPRLAPASGEISIWLIVMTLITLLVGAIITLVIPRDGAFKVYAVTLLIMVPIGAAAIIRLQYRCHVPYDSAAVIERMGLPRVAFGPQTITLLPPADRLRAIVPLYRLEYLSSKQKVIVNRDLTVEVSLAMHYGIAGADVGERVDSIVKTIYQLSLGSGASPNRTTQRDKGCPALSPSDLKRAWEKRLLSDLQLTLNEVLPGRRFEELWCDRQNGRLSICGVLRERLATRTQEWGMQILEISMLELNTVMV